MNKSSFAFIGLLAFMFACGETVKETPSGLKYTVIRAGDGVVPEPGQVLVFHYELKDSKDSVWGETFTSGIPAATRIDEAENTVNEDGMTQMFRQLSVGDSVKTEMAVTDFFSNIVRSPLPPQVDSALAIKYTIKVRNITSVEEFLSAREADVLKRDTDQIKRHLAEENFTAQQDTSGLQYIIHTSGGGTKPSAENCVEVKYTGRFLETGEIFDQADRISFPLEGVIAGWRLGIPMLGIGDSGTFYIPSKLAYGPQGYPGAIPPDAVLVFDVTLLDVKSEFDQATRSCK